VGWLVGYYTGSNVSPMISHACFPKAWISSAVQASRNSLSSFILTLVCSLVPSFTNFLIAASAFIILSFVGGLLGLFSLEMSAVVVCVGNRRVWRPFPKRR
jgi:hypothetical protein